jgi:hypothetical protein
MNELLIAIKEWVEAFEGDFEAFKKSLERELARAQNSIVRRILAEIIPLISTDNGAFKVTVSNLAKSNLIERVFDEMNDEELKPILRRFADELLAISGRNAEFYIASGFDATKVAAIAEDLYTIRTLIGLNSQNELLKDGYLWRLGRTEAVRDRLKQYLLTSIASGQSVKQFETGLKVLVSGNAEVDGALVNYWRQYAYDTHARIREVNNIHFADELGLQWFIYQGGIISTSRAFCVKKNGKVFSKEEAQRDWPKDTDLINKANKATYKPLIDRGRNNCRHFLMWISEERAKEIRGIQ